MSSTNLGAHQVIAPLTCCLSMTEGRSDNFSADDPRSPDWEAFARQVDGMRLSAPSDIETEAALRKVKANPGFDRRRARWVIPMPAVAAAALLAVGLASWMAYRNRSPVPVVASIQGMFGTGVGSRDSLTLMDGTRVVIGPLSSITVPADYGTASRSVEVKGDAWFDVVHNAEKPFTVHAGGAAIVDVGTKFTVKSDDPAGVSVSVSEGSVSLRQVNTPVQQGVILKAGDNGVLRNGGKVIARRGGATEDDVAWLKGRLVFREAPISEIASSMRKWYGIELKVPDQTLASRHITASFAGESPERVLEVIRLALGAEIERHGDTAIVRSAKGNMR